MRFNETAIAGVILIEPDVYRDARGYFLETFHAAKYAEAGIPASFVQDNQSVSVRNTLRSLLMMHHRGKCWLRVLNIRIGAIPAGPRRAAGDAVSVTTRNEPS